MQKENKKREQPVKKSNKPAVNSFDKLTRELAQKMKLENISAKSNENNKKLKTEPTFDFGENTVNEIFGKVNEEIIDKISEKTNDDNENAEKSIITSEKSADGETAKTVEEMTNQTADEQTESSGNFDNSKTNCNSNCCEKDCNENLETTENSTGSLGKFKDAQSLLIAYNNLQAEFTRKCQRLKEFERTYEPESWRTTIKSNENLNDKKLDNKIALEKLFSQISTTENEQINPQEINVQNLAEKQLQSDFQTKQLQTENKSQLQTENFQEEIKSQANQLSENQTKEQMESQNTNIEDLLKNPQVKEYILNRDDIKENVLKIYFKELRESNPPKVISSLIGSGIALKTPPKPTNMEEAKEIINKMFHLK